MDDDDFAGDMLALGDDLVYEIPHSFSDMAASIESIISKSKQKRRQSKTKKECHLQNEINGKTGFFGADPLSLELKRFLEDNDQNQTQLENIIEIETEEKEKDELLLKPSNHIPATIYKIDKVPVGQDHQKLKSSLTALVERKAEINNPLAAQYSAYVNAIFGLIV